MRGHITRRGKSSWRIKFDTGSDHTGRRKTRYVTVRGTKADAQRELTRLLAATDTGTLVDPRKTSIAEYMREWFDGPNDLAPKTLERYRELAELQIFPTLGGVALQKLKPAAVQEWHTRLLKRALQRAVATELLARNPAAAISPPKVTDEEVKILGQDQVQAVLKALAGHDLYPIAALALATGARRGELLGLQLQDIDLDRAELRIERSLEETKAGLRFKAPKTKHGRRTISLPASAVDVIREQRRKLLELRIALGLGRPRDDALLFARIDGSPLSPDALSRGWLKTLEAMKQPRVRFHALRHTHASALIAAGIDVVTISRRMGHANPQVTLTVYAHLFIKSDTAAAHAIDAVLRT